MPIYGEIHVVTRPTLLLSDTMYSIISLKKSTPPQNGQLNVLIINSKQ